MNIKLDDLINKITCADCMDILPQLPDKCVDLVLTDPPYGIGMDGGNVGYKGLNNFTKKTGILKYPMKKHFMKYLEFRNNRLFGVEIISV